MLKRLLKLFSRSKKYTKDGWANYALLYHRVGRRLGIARAQVRFLKGELEGVYERLETYQVRMLEQRKEIRALKAQVAALSGSEEVTNPRHLEAISQ